MKSPGLNQHIGGAVIAWVLIAGGYGHAKADAVPNLVGAWVFTVGNEVSYKNLGHPNAAPVFASDVPTDARLVSPGIAVRLISAVPPALDLRIARHCDSPRSWGSSK